MTEARAYAVLMAIGLIVLTAAWIILHALGVSREGLIAMSLVPMSITCFLSGFVPERYPRRPRRR
jgi:hypothetical protein